MTYVLRLLGLAAAPWSTPHDGEYLREVVPGSGRPGEMAVIVTTPDKTVALNYPDAETASAQRYVTNPNDLWRPDGEPNYPLARFNLVAEEV